MSVHLKSNTLLWYKWFDDTTEDREIIGQMKQRTDAQSIIIILKQKKKKFIKKIEFLILRIFLLLLIAQQRSNDN